MAATEMPKREGRSDVPHQNGLLEAGYDGVKLELEASERELERLQQRADKLRAALAALQELIPGRQPAPTNGAADGEVWLKH